MIVGAHEKSIQKKSEQDTARDLVGKFVLRAFHPYNWFEYTEQFCVMAETHEYDLSIPQRGWELTHQLSSINAAIVHNISILSKR